MTKNNTKDSTASEKVAKVSDQIKAATAEASGKSTAVKVNTGKSSKTAKAGAKSDSAVKVNIKKTQTARKPQAPKKSGSNVPNKRILNVVELGENNKAIDGMVKQSADVAKPKPDEASEVVSKPKPAQTQEKSAPAVEPKRKSTKKNKKKMPLIILAVMLVIGIIAGVVVWMLNRNSSICEVKFESNGGSEVESVEVVCGGKVSQPDDPEKDGFEFREWAYRGKKFDFDNDTVDEDIILVAKWDASDDTETVTISFDSAGGSEVEDLVIKAGTATMAPSDPVREGYTFDGWYLDDEKFDFSQPIEEDVTLVAHWSGGSQNTSSENNSRPSNSTTSGSSSSSSNTQQSTTTNTSSSSNSGSSSAGNGSATGSGDNSNPDSGNGDGSSGGDDNSNVPNPDNGDNSDQD